MHKTIFIAVLLAAATQAFAQSTRPSPALSPNVSPPSLQSATAAPVSATKGYYSAFSDYRPFEDPQPASWRELNERARELGGHRGQMRQDAPAATPVPATSPAAAVPHRQ